MGLQFRKLHLLPDGNTVIDNVKIRALEIDDAFAAGIHHVCVANIPFFGDSPVKDLRAGGHFAECQRNELSDRTQGLTQAFAGDAATNWIEISDQAVQFTTDTGASRRGLNSRRIHWPKPLSGSKKTGYLRSRSRMVRSADGHSMPKEGSFQ